MSEPGALARSPGVFLDDAGDGWIVGIRETFTGFIRLDGRFPRRQAVNATAKALQIAGL